MGSEGDALGGPEGDAEEGFGSGPAPSSAPAGWYPVDGGGQRYWDGATWTEHVAPAPGAVPPGPSSVPSGPSSVGPDSAPFPAPVDGLPGAPGVVTPDDRTMALLIHLLALVSGFLGPLIIWLVKRDQSAFVDHHGKEGLNFQLTLLLAWFVAMLAALILIGLLLIPVLLVLQILFPILAAVAANRGELYRYPLTIRFIS